jgi:hypothetical protein
MVLRGLLMDTSRRPCRAPWLLVTAAILALVATACGVAEREVAGTSASIPDSQPSPEPTADDCDAIAKEKSRLLEVDPWNGVQQLISGAGVIARGTVSSVTPSDADGPSPQPSSVEPALTRYDADLVVTDVLKADGGLRVGDKIPVGNGAIRGDVQDEPCLILSRNQDVVVGLVWEESVGRYLLFNVDSVFYLSADGEVVDTGRNYGGIEQLEALPYRDLRQLLTDTRQ